MTGFETITLNPPELRGNEIYFSWQPNKVFKISGYWVRYPSLSDIQVSPGKLAEAYFPVCLAFAATGNIRFRMPARIDPEILQNWQSVFSVLADTVYKQKYRIEFEGGEDPAYREGKYTETALFFGGGTESLLTLARLRAGGTSPYLISYGGPDWAGSNPETNPDKFTIDERASADMRLRLVRVFTNFKEAVNTPAWSAFVKPGFSMINAGVFMPFFLSFALPVCEQLGIEKLVSGNEKMNYPEEYFCFSSPVTALLKNIAKHITYESQLGDLLKEEVCAELYRKYPEMAAYQYSCWRNRKERWCHQCESCLEYYMLLLHNGLKPETVGLDEERIHRNRRKLVWEVSRSAEARRREIWERICAYADLRKRPVVRQMLDEIRLGSFVYHGLYKRFPEGVREAVGLRRLAERLKT